MKTIKFILASVFTIFLFTVSAQETKPIKPFSDFNGDSVAYMKYNWSGELYRHFRNKPLSVLFDNFDLPIKSFMLRVSREYVVVIMFYTQCASNILKMNESERAKHGLFITAMRTDNYKFPVSTLYGKLPIIESEKIIDWLPSYEILLRHFMMNGVTFAGTFE